MTLILAVLVSLVFAVTSFAAVTGSKHDISKDGGQVTADAQVCVYCHTPHSAKIDIALDYNPLWNMEVVSTVFTGYTSSTFSGAIVADALAGPSRLCMSCHDGTIAIDSALDGTTPSTMMIANGKVIGDTTGNFQTDSLASDHPIGFTYPAMTDTVDEILPATTSYGGTGNTIGSFLYGVDNLMTCATCHDVHDDTHGNFLLADNALSALCTSCHVK